MTTGKVLLAQSGVAYPAQTDGVAALLSSVSVDLTVAGATLLYTPTGVSSYISYVIIRCTSAESVSFPLPTIRIGSNPSTYDNIVPAQVLYGLTTVRKWFVYAPMASVILSSGTDVSIDVVTASDAGRLLVNVDLFGVEF